MKNIHVYLQVEIPVKDGWDNCCSMTTVRQEAIDIAMKKLGECIKDTHIRIDTACKNKVIIVC